MTQLTIVAAVVVVVFGGVNCYLAWMLGGVVRKSAEERRELYQRIQAPREAIIERQLETESITYTPPAVAFDDDEDFWDARALTKEQLAEQAYDAG